MRLAVLKERRAGETRVAATPETVRKLAALGLSVAVEAGAGAGASIPDADYGNAGAEIAPDAGAALAGAGVVLAVQPPEALAAIPRGALLVCISGAMADRDSVPRYAEAGIDVAAMELLPRITRAQSMDVLSSQANLAGYRSVIEGAAAFDRGFPMMMTAAGTVPPARVFVVGAGVAGLQAIATARRLGAIVSATDVRPAAKEEIKSLGAAFVGVEDTETAGQTGAYAKEMSADFRRKQAELMMATVAKNDMVICTALVQGGRAPVLVTQAMVDGMRPGSVIVDLASDGGGNCEATRPGEAYVTANGVKVLGYRNWPGRIAVAASALYAKNLLTFVTTFWDKEAGAPKLPEDDAIVQGVILTRGGAVVHAGFAPAAPAAAPAQAAPATETPPDASPDEASLRQSEAPPAPVENAAFDAEGSSASASSAGTAGLFEPALGAPVAADEDTELGVAGAPGQGHPPAQDEGADQSPVSTYEPPAVAEDDGGSIERTVPEPDVIGGYAAPIESDSLVAETPVVAVAPQPPEEPAGSEASEPTAIGGSGGALPDVVSESASLPPEPVADPRPRRGGGGGGRRNNRPNPRPAPSSGDDA